MDVDMNNMEKIKNHFEEEANKYDDIILKLIPFYKEMIEALVSSIPFDKNKEIKVIDLGCGTGTISKEIKRNFSQAKFIFVDIANNMLDIAKSKLNNSDKIISTED